jgi:hypothetical protein
MASGRNHSPVGGKRHVQDAAVVPHFTRLLTRRHGPKSCPVIVARRYESRPANEFCIHYSAVVPHWLAKRLGRFNCPQLRRTVFITGDKYSSIGTNSDDEYRGANLYRGTMTLAARNVPQSRRAVSTPTRYQIAGGVKCHRENLVLVLHGWTARLAIREIPELHTTILTSRDERLVNRIERYCMHRATQRHGLANGLTGQHAPDLNHTVLVCCDNSVTTRTKPDE